MTMSLGQPDASPAADGTAKPTSPETTSSRVRRTAVGLLTSAIPPVIGIVVLVAIWQLCVSAFDLEEYVLPSPGKVFHQFTKNFSTLWEGVRVTGVEVLYGFVISIGLGLPLGVILAKVTVLRRMFYPLIVVAQIVPKIAFGPVMIVWFGFGSTPKIALIVLLAFFPIMISAMTGVEASDREFKVLARALGLGPLATFRKIDLPQALPSVFSGLKVSITLAVIGAVVAEFLTSESGIGHQILVAQGNVDTALMFAALIALTLMGLVFYAVLEVCEYFFLSWHRQARIAS